MWLPRSPKHQDLNLFGSILLAEGIQNPLVFINRMRNHNQRLSRWGLLLQEYNLDIRHIRGKENVIADALSRVEEPQAA